MRKTGITGSEQSVQTSLDRAAAMRHLNCFTAMFANEALAAATAIDVAPGPLPLRGMTFAAKDLFDVAGRTTLAGSRINEVHPAATQSATSLLRLQSAGAVLVGLTNMDEFAYGFSTENAHYGPTRNPHDPGRIAGGSSGGSAAAVAAGIVSIALGSDTNGSIRVPASLCGVYGLKPTYGRLSRAGAFPFVADLDHIGPFARTVGDLAAAYDALQGPDPRDSACLGKREEVASGLTGQPPADLRVGVLQGWFRQGAQEDVCAALDQVAAAFPRAVHAELASAQAARSAAFCLTAMAGADLHSKPLRTRPMDFDPAVRDRLLAGLMLPAETAYQVRRARRRLMDEALQLFQHCDVLLAPATPCRAPEIGQDAITIEGREVSVRANLGLYTQPISFIGLPVIAAPVRVAGLPIGIQIIGPPWREDLIFQAAAHLERAGMTGAFSSAEQQARVPL